VALFGHKYALVNTIDSDISLIFSSFEPLVSTNF
jgi:hypothetical protein